MNNQPAKSEYPKAADIRRVMRAVQVGGLSIGSVHIGSDGSIHIGRHDIGTNGPVSDFDRLDAAGLL